MQSLGAFEGAALLAVECIVRLRVGGGGWGGPVARGSNEDGKIFIGIVSF